jgi:hypothetical protein
MLIYHRRCSDNSLAKSSPFRTLHPISPSNWWARGGRNPRLRTITLRTFSLFIILTLAKLSYRYLKPSEVNLRFQLIITPYTPYSFIVGSVLSLIWCLIPLAWLLCIQFPDSLLFQEVDIILTAVTGVSSRTSNAPLNHLPSWQMLA